MLELSEETKDILRRLYRKRRIVVNIQKKRTVLGALKI